MAPCAMGRFFVLLRCAEKPAARGMKRKHPISLVVHGGAWDIPGPFAADHKAGVLKALRLGWEVLQDGGTAVDAVEHSIMAMEDDETFNAGRGSCLNAAGEVECDAIMMSGRSLRAGAVGAVQSVVHPISLARAIMEKSEHVLLVGLGASRFAKEHRIRLCPPDELIIEREIARWRQSQSSAKESTKRRSEKSVRSLPREGAPADTVGAVALDSSGDLASGNSTGGTPNKYPGRIGDSALLGSGTYADNAVGAAASTGWGEGIMRVLLAKSVIDRMAIRPDDVERAVKDGIALLKKRTGGQGGVIALSASGGVAIAYSTPRMARAYFTSSMKSPVAAV